jgi:hypothetical protein
MSSERLQVAAPASATVRYGIRRLVEKTGATVVDRAQRRLEVAIDAALGREAYRVEHRGQSVRVTRGDDVGVLYGLLETAERAWITAGTGSPRPPRRRASRSAPSSSSFPGMPIVRGRP